MSRLRLGVFLALMISFVLMSFAAVGGERKYRHLTREEVGERLARQNAPYEVKRGAATEKLPTKDELSKLLSQYHDKRLVDVVLRNMIV